MGWPWGISYVASHHVASQPQATCVTLANLGIGTVFHSSVTQQQALMCNNLCLQGARTPTLDELRTNLSLDCPFDV